MANQVERVTQEMKVLRFEVGGDDVVKAVMSEETKESLGEI
jgi:hypothetical protein